MYIYIYVCVYICVYVHMSMCICAHNICIQYTYKTSIDNMTKHVMCNV